MNQDLSENMSRAVKVAKLREQEEALCQLPNTDIDDVPFLLSEEADDELYDPLGLFEEPEQDTGDMSYVDELSEGLGE